MWRVCGALLAGLFLLSGTALLDAQTPGGIPPAASDPLAHSISTGIEKVLESGDGECTRALGALREAQESVDRDRRQLAQSVGTGAASPDNRNWAFPSDLRQDLIVFEQRQAARERCRNHPDAGENDPPPGASCPAELLLNFQVSRDDEYVREVPILRMAGDSAFFYSAGMTIDADGAPNAYSPDNTGLDDLINAGAPGDWPGLAKNGNGDPFIQTDDDPFPGYFVSETALVDRTRAVNDPRRYVDAGKIPYVVLPGWLARQLGARPGDLAAVVNQRTGISSSAIFGDIGPSDRIGEGSIALAENLGIRSNARNGGARRGIAYLVFPGSGNGGPRTVEEIQEESDQLFKSWGGAEQLANCAIAPPEGNRNLNTN